MWDFKPKKKTNNQHLLKRTRCEKCKVTFVRETPEQTHCYRCLIEEVEVKRQTEYSKDHTKRTAFRKCANCHKEFYSATKRTYCSDSCRQATYYANKKMKATPKDHSKSNEKWLEDKPKRKGKSLDQLNKESEYKRVFDDKGWDHYLKGRNWNNI